MTHPPVPPPPSGDFPPPAGNLPPGGYYPPPQAYQLPKAAYTPWITRVAAYFIDMLPVALLAGIGQAFMAVTATKEPRRGEACGFYNSESQCTYVEPTTTGLLVAVVLGLAALAFAVWNYGYRQGSTGSSIGKSVMKFKVVSEKTGQPIGFWPSLGRQLAHLLDSAFCSIGYLWPLWDSKRQTFADKIMATICLPI